MDKIWVTREGNLCVIVLSFACFILYLKAISK